MKTFPLPLLLVLAFGLAMPAPAATLVSGHYTIAADLSAVLLNGRYPFTLSDVPAQLDVTTLPTGAITGQAVIFGEQIQVAGRILAASNKVRLSMRSVVARRGFILVATQKGGAFVGFVQLGRVRRPVSISLIGSGTVRPTYEVALTVKPNGVISGVGTMRLAQQEIAVSASGREIRGKASLLLRGGRTFLRVAGPVDAGGIAGPWAAQGFGAIMRGGKLSVSPVSN